MRQRDVMAKLTEAVEFFDTSVHMTPGQEAAPALSIFVAELTALRQIGNAAHRRAQAAEAELSERAQRHRDHMKHELEELASELVKVRDHRDALQRMIDRHAMQTGPLVPRRGDPKTTWQKLIDFVRDLGQPAYGTEDDIDDIRNEAREIYAALDPLTKRPTQ